MFSQKLYRVVESEKPIIKLIAVMAIIRTHASSINGLTYYGMIFFVSFIVKCISENEWEIVRVCIRAL